MGHKYGAVDYDKSVQEVSVYRCLSGQKEQGNNDYIDEGKDEGKKTSRVEYCAAGVCLVRHHKKMDPEMKHQSGHRQNEERRQKGVFLHGVRTKTRQYGQGKR